MKQRQNKIKLNEINTNWVFVASSAVLLHFFSTLFSVLLLEQCRKSFFSSWSILVKLLEIPSIWSHQASYVPSTAIFHLTNFLRWWKCSKSIFSSYSIDAIFMFHSCKQNQVQLMFQPLSLSHTNTSTFIWFDLILFLFNFPQTRLQSEMH